MEIDGGRLAALERRLDGARLWGVEIDLRYRVAGVTFEVDPDRHPLGTMFAHDPRLQVLLFPVGRLTGSLRPAAASAPVPVAVERLVELVESFDGPRISAPLFDGPAPDLGSTPSFSGSTSARDGWAHRFTVRLSDADGRSLILELTFDAVRVRTAAGEEVAPGSW